MATFYATPETNLQRMLDGCKSGDVIRLSEGVFRQKIEIDVDGITIVGAGEKSVLVYDDYAKKLDDNGVEYVTFRTYTVAVCANGVTLKNLRIENDAGNSPKKGQEVAISVCGSDFIAENCTFISEQDTVFCGPLPPDLIQRYDGFLKDKLRKNGSYRQLFYNCIIAGTVDFIFGCADALFENCTIISIDDGRTGFVAAPAHCKEQTIGFVFDNCKLICDENMPAEKVFLARPWRDFGKVTFVDCTYGNHVKSEGFDKWNDTERDKTARFAESQKQSGRVFWSKQATRDEISNLLLHFDHLKRRLQR